MKTSTNDSGFISEQQAEILARSRYRWSKWTPAGVRWLAEMGMTPDSQETQEALDELQPRIEDMLDEDEMEGWA